MTIDDPNPGWAHGTPIPGPDSATLHFPRCASDKPESSIGGISQARLLSERPSGAAGPKILPRRSTSDARTKNDSPYAIKSFTT